MRPVFENRQQWGVLSLLCLSQGRWSQVVKLKDTGNTQPMWRSRAGDEHREQALANKREDHQVAGESLSVQKFCDPFPDIKFHYRMECL